ncbi:MAG: right-handed parallel beta-helix repeat-containing protein [Acidimicrobiia bacterium]|nr:right-handed parallel beta-helix repeat-containing protein [Acidimicrobiia bacterium]MDH5289513.1 right-handed parallel beta-helix repeat-containing protein [Acidimicrobiia bacterium]
MAVRLAHHRRVATAALLLCFVLGTMLLTLGSPGPAPQAGRDDAHGRRARAADVVAPVGAGTTREVRSLADWELAVASAQPGDVLRLRSDIPGRLVYQGRHDGSGGPGPDGTAQAPIVITADPGVWIDPGNQSSGQGALDVIAADHVHVVGVSVRNAQFGIRCLQCRGSDDQPVRIAANRVTLAGHAGIHVGGHWASHAPSSWVVVEDNVVDLTGRTAATYGEGIYLGYGGAEWVDTTGDVTVRGNDISQTGAEGIDIKPGTRDITVVGNAIHDLAPLNGGAISAHYVNLVPNPHPGQLDAVTVRANRIWNLNLAGTPGSNDWAIWVGHGGVDVVENWIWGLRGDPAAARAVRVRATQDFGPHPIRIRDNVFWTARGWVAEGRPSGAANVAAGGNRGVDPGSSELVVDAAMFPGPVPAIGAGGTADGGAGPGSGLGWSSLITAQPAADPATTARSPATTVWAADGERPADGVGPGPLTGAAGSASLPPAGTSAPGTPSPIGPAVHPAAVEAPPAAALPLPLDGDPPVDLLAYQGQGADDPVVGSGGRPRLERAPTPMVAGPSPGRRGLLAPSGGYGIVGALALAAAWLGSRAARGGTV